MKKATASGHTAMPCSFCGKNQGMPNTLKDISAALGLCVPERFWNRDVRTLLTDSRSLLDAAATLFFAIRTPRGDGHGYVEELYRRGVRLFVVDTLPQRVKLMPEALWLKVPSVLEALQRVGGLGRENAAQVVAVTGSRGKTSLKEWMYQLLRHDMKVWRSPRSFNSQIGVPLSLWAIPSDAELAVIEAGVSRKGEMEALATCIAPDSVVVTNLGAEHDEGFCARLEKGMEKLRLAAGPGVKMLVMPADPVLEEARRQLGLKLPTVTWQTDGGEGQSKLKVEVKGNGEGRRVSYVWEGVEGVDRSCPAERGEFGLPGERPEEVENISAALAWMLAAGIGSGSIRRYGSELRHVETRLDVSEGVNGCSVVWDSYTSDAGSLAPAIDLMKRRESEGQTITVVLSDLMHDPTTAETGYADAARVLKEAGVSRFIGIGKEIAANASCFPAGSEFFESTDDFLARLSTSDFSHEAVLLKGGSGFGFERIKEMLELRTHETVLEVNLSAVVANFNYFRSQTRPGTGIIAMVKASGYGAGSLETARALQDAGAAYLAVAVLDEGIDLREQGVTMPIMVMNPKVVNYRQMFAHRLEPEIYSLDMLRDVIREGAKCGVKEYPVHLKLDTGMHRMGLVEEEIPEAMDMLLSQGNISLSSVFSHLATADCQDMDDYTRGQLELFERLTGDMLRRMPNPFKRHILNTAGILRFPEYDYDMVRLGIGLYGVDTLPPDIEQPLKTVSTLRTVIICLREWKAGESIGYGRRTVLERDSVIATLPIGYADGMDRHLGNGAVSVWVNGRMAPTAGNICMDACMIDVTGIDCKVGDAVEIFGPNAPVGRLSDTLGTIPYEILTSVSPRVKRIYFRE